MTAGQPLSFSASDPFEGDPSRVELHGSLTKIKPVLGELYLAAFEQLQRPTRSRVRLYLIAYILRELVNNFVAVVGEQSGRDHPKSTKGDTDRLLEELVSVWPNKRPATGVEDSVEEDQTEGEDGDTPSISPKTPVAISGEVAALITDLVAKRIEGSANARAAAAFAALGHDEATKDATVNVLVNSQKFFGRFLHLARAGDGPLPDEEDVAHNFRVHEEVLRYRIGSFFKLADELEGLAARANERERDGSGDFVPPDLGLLDSTLARLGDDQHRRLFYERLENPLWVKPLTERGALSPPELERLPDGYVQAAPWPAGEYLVRMASAAPGDVANALLACIGTENYIARRTLVMAASKLPVTSVTPLLRGIMEYLKQPQRELLAEDALGTILISLCKEGSTKSLSFADDLFKPLLSREEFANGSRDPAAGIGDSYRYGLALNQVRTALAAIPEGKGRKRIMQWLTRWQNLTRNYNPTTGFDQSQIWRPYIAESEHNSGLHEIGDLLVGAVRDNTLELIASGGEIEEILQELETFNRPLLARIALYAVTWAVGEGVDGAIAAAQVRLLRPDSLNDVYRFEYVQLARTILGHLDPETLSSFGAMSAASPNETNESLSDFAEYMLRSGREGEVPTAVTDADIVRVKMILQRDLLAAIGNDYLPPALQSRLSALSAAVGAAPEGIGQHRPMVASIVRRTPISASDLDQLSVPEVISFVSAWRPEQARMFEPTMNDLAGEVSGWVTRHPELVAEQAELFSALRPIYVQAIFSGLRTVLKEQRQFRWGNVLALAVAVGVLDRESQAGSGKETEYWIGEDHWRHVQEQIVGLLDDAVTADGPSRLPDDTAARVFEILEPLSSGASDSEGADRTDMDALTTSLNDLRCSAIRTLIHYVLWLRGADAKTDVSDLRDRALAHLDARLGWNADPSLLVAAVWAQTVGQMLDQEAAWFSPRLPRLLGNPAEPLDQQGDGAAYADVVWSITLALYRPSRFLLENLLPWYVQRISDLGSDRTETRGWKSEREPRYALADHILMFEANGSIDLVSEVHSPAAKLLPDLFREGRPELLGDALDRLGWGLFRNRGEISADAVERCMKLWAWRMVEFSAGRGNAQEFTGFGWWISSALFPSSWWLPRLVEILEHVEVSSQHHVGEALAAAAPEQPGLAVQALKLMLGPINQRDWTKFDLIESAPTIFASALDSSDAEAQQAAQELMDALGRAGYVNIKRDTDGKRTE